MPCITNDNHIFVFSIPSWYSRCFLFAKLPIIGEEAATLKKFVLIALVCMLMGCGGDQAWFSFDNSMEGLGAGSKKATIDKSEFKS